MENKYGKIEFVKAEISDIDEIVKLNQLYIEKLHELPKSEISTELSALKTKIELRIDQYEVIVSGDIKLGYFYCYRNGNDAVIEDFQLYPQYDCKEVVLRVLYWGRCHLSKTGDTLFINNVDMSDKKRLSIYERDEFKFDKMVSTKRGMMKWVWYNMWWM